MAVIVLKILNRCLFGLLRKIFGNYGKHKRNKWPRGKTINSGWHTLPQNKDRFGTFEEIFVYPVDTLKMFYGI